MFFLANVVERLKGKIKKRKQDLLRFAGKLLNATSLIFNILFYNEPTYYFTMNQI